MPGSPSVGFQAFDRNSEEITLQSLPIGSQPGEGSVSVVFATNALAEPGGVAADGVNPLAGGLGHTGWLSSSYYVLTQIHSQLSGNLNVSFGAGAEVSGKFNIDQITPGTSNGVVVNSSALPEGAATSALQSALNTALGTPLQAGGSVSISGSALPEGAATAAKQDSLLTALGTPLQAGGAVSVSSSALPTGAATEFGNLATIVTNTTRTANNLSTLLSALQAQKFMTVWTDNTAAYFLLQLAAGGVPTWTTTEGVVCLPPGVGMRIASGVSVIVDATRYQANIAGTGYNVNDYLSHVVTTDPTSGSVLGFFWLNVSTNSKLVSSPSAANISPITALPVGSALDGIDNTGVAQLNTGWGNRGWLSGIYSKLAGPLTVNGAVSVSSSALPTGASTAAKQDSLLTALGTPLQAGGTVLVSGVATAAKQDSLLTALGTPLQAGGTVLVSGVATAAGITALGNTIIAALGTPLQAGGSVSVSSAPQNTVAVSEYVNITPNDSTILSGLIGLRADCTVAGVVVLGGANASVYTWKLGVGLNQLPDSVKYVKATGLTATAIFTGLK
jgi:hypothetical protein